MWSSSFVFAKFLDRGPIGSDRWGNLSRKPQALSIELIFSPPCPIKKNMSNSISTSKRTGKKFHCLCSACGKDFGGVRAFDLHRVGKHAYSYSPERPDGRRCLSEQEMLARGR
jgi:hypothetical protein